MDKTERDCFEWLQQRVIAQNVVLDGLITMMAETAPDRDRFARDLVAAVEEAGGRSYPSDRAIKGYLAHVRALLHGR
ncbi:hypothetical protein [Stappia sp. ES.058]|uniref:hypothetical protein n=1 Tax=Stappia sp. ES.058 TaxID=1881061 RepID=UPI00087DEF7D|nr:hypothetical protein [Stappia sp. ES.058]SDT96688.1 hypothetical protein SAMN05428979_0783 [Stappia sp. ES.058]